MIRIITDSGADFEPEELSRLNVECVPMTVTFGNTQYKENVNLTKEGFYRLLENEDEIPKTSQPNVADFKKAFEQAKQSGDEIIAVLISSQLSGAAQSAFMAANFNHQSDCCIFDSGTAAAGQRLLVEYAVKLRDEGKSALEIVRALGKIKQNVKMLACLDTLKYLHKGGRLSGTVAAIGSVAHIKAIASLNGGGTVTLSAKAFGRQGAMLQILKKLSAGKLNPDFPIYVMYSHNRSLGQELAQKLREAGYRVDDRHIVGIGASIGTHIGANSFGIAYVTKEEQIIKSTIEY